MSNRQIRSASVHRNTYRIICLLAGILIPIFGIIYAYTEPNAVDPLRLRFGVAILTLLLLTGSYMNSWIERRFIGLAHLLFYVILAYLVGITAYNQFSPNYTVGMLFAITAMGVAFSLGLKNELPLVQYLTASVFLVVPTLFFVSVDEDISPLIIAISTVSIAIILYVVGRAKIEAEKSRKTSEHRYHTLMDSAEDGIFIIDAESKTIIDCNSKAQELTGRTEVELRGMSQSELFPPEMREQADQVFTGHAMNGTDIDDQLFLRKKNGQSVPVDISASLVNIGDTKLIQGIFRDATRRHQYERNLVEAKERAEELLQLKSSLLHNMSHELRTPITSIVGFAEILEEEAPDRMKKHAVTIYQSAKRLMETLHSVLDLAKLQSNQTELDPEVIEVGAEVEEAVSLLEPIANKKSLELSVDIACDQPVHIRADSSCLNRTINNLVGNALKFTSDGSVTVTVDQDGRHVFIEVTDTGIGIEEEFIEHLFEAFRQESTGLSRSHEGTGLGLAITKRLVDLMDGSIDVDSEKGVGSTFIVKLPRVQPVKRGTTSPDENGQPASESELSANGATERLLVVEDNLQTQSLIKHRLPARFEAVCVETPSKAIDVAQKKEFDGFLLDIGLGSERDGIDVLNELREIPQYADVPAIALTAYAMPGDEERFLGLGFDFYLSKPFTKKQFLETINEAFSSVAKAE